MSFGWTREMPTVRLGPDDLIEATKIGHARDDSLEIGRDPDSTGFHGDGSADSHTLGVKGELAVGGYYDLPIDDETYAGGDGGTDFEAMYHGEREVVVDVKTTSYSPADLLVRASSTGADVYILAEYIEKRMEIRLAGMATKQMVENADKQRSKYGHMNYVIPRGDLREVPGPDELTAAVETNEVTA